MGGRADSGCSGRQGKRVRTEECPRIGDGPGLATGSLGCPGEGALM